MDRADLALLVAEAGGVGGVGDVEVARAIAAALDAELSGRRGGRRWEAAIACAIAWSGDEAVRWYASSPKARRAFCGHCGSRLAKDPHGSPKVLVSVGLFPGELARRLLEHVFATPKPAWYDVPAEPAP